MKGRSHRLQNSDPPDDWVNGSWTVDCVCGVNFDDGEEMVNCDECGVWVHTRCSRYVKGDEIFVCDKCKSKNNRNDNEETEVAQLLVELPTKTMRMESTYLSNGPTHGPFKLWTDIPKEEKVHVHGIPSGDPALFEGLSSVFTPQLWKCTGYVPKKFNLQYKEFPCWDEKEGDEENENPVDKGAGVLFSLSKESMLAAPAAALVGQRGGDAKGASLKERMKWKSENMDAMPMHNGLKKERSLLGPMVLHSSKRKKDDLGTSKYRSSKKKSRATEKEADMKKRAAHSSRTVFTSTSDGKQLEFYEDRGPKFSKVVTQSMKDKYLRNTAGKQSSSDGCGEHDDAEKHSSESLSTDVHRRDFSTGEGPKKDKLGHLSSATSGSSPKTDGFMGPFLENNIVRNFQVQKEWVDSMIVDNFDDSVKAPDRKFMEPPVEDMTCTIPETKDSQVHHSNCETSVRSEKPGIEVKIEDHDDNSRSFLHIQYFPQGDGKDHGLSSVHMPASGTKSHSGEHKAQDDDRSLEAVINSNTDRDDNLLGVSFQHKPESEGLEDSNAMQKNSSEPKHDSGFIEEHSKPSGTISNSSALPIQMKTEECAGKSVSSSTSMLIPVSSTMDSSTSADALNSNKSAKQQILPDCNGVTKKDQTSYDVRDEERNVNPRRNSREISKSATTSTTKSFHSSRISHDYASKQTMLESKDSVPGIASKTSPASTSVVSVSCEPTGSLHHQKAIHTHGKRLSSSVSQKGEKHNQTNFHPSSKVNQNRALSPRPPAPSSTKLSDEELALLLHQELNSSPRVPRVPRMRNAGSLPQLASPSATSMLMKRSSNSGGKDHSLVFRRKGKDASKDGIRNSRENADESKRMDRFPSSHDQRKQDVPHVVDASTRREVDGSSTAVESVNIAIPTTSSATANSGPSSSTEANDHNLSSVRSSPRNTSDDDTGTVGGPVHRTLPGLINEIMSKGKRMTYEELCNAVLPHWHNLRKHNGERYAYTSHSQAVLDCLRNRHEWARLVDRGPKTNSSRKRRKVDGESEDNDYSKGKNSNQAGRKSLESRREEFPKGKRKARKRRRLALQGRVKDFKRRRKIDVISDDDIGTSANSSVESMSSEDCEGEIQGGGAEPDGSEASDSSDEMVTV